MILHLWFSSFRAGIGFISFHFLLFVPFLSSPSIVLLFPLSSLRSLSPTIFWLYFHYFLTVSVNVNCHEAISNRVHFVSALSQAYLSVCFLHICHLAFKDIQLYLRLCLLDMLAVSFIYSYHWYWLISDSSSPTRVGSSSGQNINAEYTTVHKCEYLIYSLSKSNIPEIVNSIHFW